MKDRLESLDSLRGVLVLCILLYHYLLVFEPGLLSFFEGGFLAVEVFIVLSGFLITRLLLRGNFSEFLLRRFLRLYPSLILVVASTLAVVYAKGIEPLSFAFKESLYALMSVYNYYLVFSDIPYFERFEKEVVFLPLWSLSMEIQLYLVSFLLFLTLPRRLLPYAYAVIAVVSACISFYYFHVLKLETDNIYFRTEARAHAFFVGGLLAFYEERIPYLLQTFGRALRVTLIVFVSLLLLLSFVKFNVYTEWFFPFGFLFVDLLAVKLLAYLVQLKKGFAPLSFLGSISYPIFLWHYPLMLLTKHAQHTVYCPQCLMLLHILTLSVTTHWLVEEPFRKLKGLPSLLKLIPKASASFALIPALMMVYDYMPQRKQEEKTELPLLPVADTTEWKSYAPEERRRECSAFMIGDSVMKGAGPFLVKSYDRLVIDARVNRHFTEALQVVKKKADIIRRCEVVVVHLGHNGYPREELVRQMVEFLQEAGAKDIYFVSIKAPRLRWERSYNALLRQMQSEGKIKVIDWHSLAKPEYLYKDLIHLNLLGARVYTQMIGSALELAPSKGFSRSYMVKHEPQKVKERIGKKRETQPNTEEKPQPPEEEHLQE